MRWTCVVMFVSLATMFWLSACSGPVHTDIDSFFERFAKENDDFEYIRDCKKPKAFKGLNKFRVSCFASVKDGAWEESIEKSHSGFFYYMTAASWKAMGTTDGPKKPISKDFYERPIVVYEKITGRNKCNRRIYIDVSEVLISEEAETSKGAQIYIADPRILYCEKARLLIL